MLLAPDGYNRFRLWGSSDLLVKSLEMTELAEAFCNSFRPDVAVCVVMCLLIR